MEKNNILEGIKKYFRFVRFSVLSFFLGIVVIYLLVTGFMSIPRMLNWNDSASAISIDALKNADDVYEIAGMYKIETKEDRAVLKLARDLKLAIEPRAEDVSITDAWVAENRKITKTVGFNTDRFETKLKLVIEKYNLCSKKRYPVELKKFSVSHMPFGKIYYQVNKI